MSMDSPNGPRRPLSPASPTTHTPVQDSAGDDGELIHQGRKVSVQPEPFRLLPKVTDAHQRHFVPLTHRGCSITQPPRKIKPGKMVDFFASLAMPFVTRGLNKKNRKALKELKAKRKALEAQYRDDTSNLKTVEKRLAKIQKKTAALRKKLNTLKPGEYQSLVRARTDQAYLLSLKSELESAQKHYGTETNLINQIETKLRRQRDKTKSFLKEAVKSGARLASGLQQVFTAKSDPANKDAIYQIDLGNAVLTDEGYCDAKLEGMQIRIDRCSMDGDNFVINVTECSGKCSSKSSDATFGEPVELTGAFTFTIKPPLAGELLDVMNSASRQLPGKIQQSWAAFKDRHLVADMAGNRQGLLDFIDIDFDGVSQKDEEGRYFDLLNRTGGQILLKLLSPILQSTKQHADEAALSDLKYNVMHHRKETQRHEQNGVLLGGLGAELQQDIQALNAAGQPCEELKKLINNIGSQINDAATAQATSGKAESEEQHRLKIAQSAADGRNGRIEGFDNMINVLFTLRKAILNASEENPSVAGIKPQRIQIGESGFVDVDNLQVQVSDVRMTSDGVLTITAPSALARMTVGSELQDSHTEDMNLSGLKLTLSPPLGKLAWEVLNLKFPVSASHFNVLRKQYDALSSESALVGEGPALPTLKDLISFQLEHVESASGSRLPEESELETASLAEKVSKVSGAKIDEKELQSFLGQFVEMSDGSQRQVKSLLSMTLLGLGHAASPSPRNEESIRRLASKIASGNKSGFDEWVFVDKDDSGSESDPEEAVSEAEAVESLIQRKSTLLKGKTGQERAFDVSTDLRSLIGQIKGLFSFLIGNDSVVTVSSRIGEREVTGIRLKKGNFIRRMLVNWMLKKALKRRVGTIVALSEDRQNLVLKPWEPDKQPQPPYDPPMPPQADA